MEKNNVNGAANNEQEQNQKPEKKPGFIKRAWNKTPLWVKYVTAGVVLHMVVGGVYHMAKSRIEEGDVMDAVEDALKEAGAEVVNF